MTTGICHLSTAPVRAEPSDKAEIISQLLFGEAISVISKERQWVKIKMHWDEYEGWIDEKQFLETEIDFKSDECAFAIELTQSAINHNHHIPILLGSTLPHYDGMNFRIGKKKYVYNGQAVAATNGFDKEQMIQKVCQRYLYAPYLWGGRSPFGIDCSGLMQVIYKILNVRLPRDAYQQAEEGQVVNRVDDARTGDMAFFINEEKRVAHVGLILPDQQIIHAHGFVRIDKLDHYGIYNEQKKKYTHKLKVIKRVL